MRRRLEHNGRHAIFSLLLVFGLCCCPAQVHAAQPSTAPLALARQVIHDEPDASDCLDSQYKGDVKAFAAQLSPTFARLQRGGPRDWIVYLSDACEGGSNSAILVYKKVGARYALLLDSLGMEMIQEHAMSHGWHDLTVVSHISAAEHGLTEYRFSRGAYHAFRSKDVTEQ